MTPLPGPTPQSLPGSSATSPALRASAVVASISSAVPTIVATWPGPGPGLLEALYIYSLGLGTTEVSAWVIPRGDSAGADELLITPKPVTLINGNALIVETPAPLYLYAGDQVALAADITNQVAARVSMRTFQP